MIPSSSNKASHPKLFGVINLTPDSFSDGGVFLDHQKISSTLEDWLTIDDLVIDIGAESTAPMNQKISFEQEKQRLDFLFEHHSELLCRFRSLSFDTYKNETFFYALKKCQEMSFPGQLYWNDVSGVFDRFVTQALEENPQLTWILCHTLVPSRELSGAHKQYGHHLNPQNVLFEMTQWFKKRLEIIPKALYPQIMLDPCFGFSKDAGTNQYLCEHLESLFDSLSEVIDHQFPWLIGISKKSFLQHSLIQDRPELKPLDLKDPTFLEEVERLHYSWLRKWSASPYFRYLSFRVHHPRECRDALFA